eukprot:1632098-Prymnesium_polylepis.6
MNVRHSLCIGVCPPGKEAERNGSSARVLRVRYPCITSRSWTAVAVVTTLQSATVACLWSWRSEHLLPYLATK